MSFELEKMINNILSVIENNQLIKPEDFPNIDLYMDQVTSFMDKHLSRNSRNESDDKVLTKTMINNYAKNELLPPPIKKKYTKEHMLILIFIYYFKNVLSIRDIQNILNPITDKYFDKKKFNVEDIYEELVKHEKETLSGIEADVKKKFDASKDCYKDNKDLDADEKEMLQTFSFIAMMTFDVYARKMIIQKMIDEFAPGFDEEEETKEKVKPDKKADKKSNKKA